MPQAICPYCGTEISHLDYNSDISEWGSCDINRDDRDCNNSEINNINYYCPECEHEIDIDEDNFYPDENEEENENEPKPQPPPNEMIDNNSNSYGLRFIICPNCNEKTEITNSNEEIECPHCEITININNAKIINI